MPCPAVTLALSGVIASKTGSIPCDAWNGQGNSIKTDGHLTPNDGGEISLT